jgi:hypothetical protein
MSKGPRSRPAVAARHQALGGRVWSCSRGSLPLWPPEPARPFRLPGSADVSSPGRFVSQREAARLCGVSKDSIIRARRAGRLPGARRVGTEWQVAVDDLAAAGLLLPPAERPDDAEAGGADLAETRIELTRARERVSALEDLVARQDEELRFLRRLAADAVSGRGASE